MQMGDRDKGERTSEGGVIESVWGRVSVSEVRKRARGGVSCEGGW
jgi:hypothetical protein